MFSDWHHQMHEQMEEMDRQMREVFRIFHIPDMPSGMNTTQYTGAQCVPLSFKFHIFCSTLSQASHNINTGKIIEQYYEESEVGIQRYIPCRSCLICFSVHH